MDKSTKNPIQNALIEIEGIDHPVTTSFYGDYWRILSPGHYIIKASHPSYQTQAVSVSVGSGSAIVLNFELEPTQSKFNQIVEDMTHLISTNNYALLVCGLLIMSISIGLVSLGCYCRRSANRRSNAAASASLINPLGKHSNGFHRYNDLDDDDDEEKMRSIRRNVDDGKKNGAGISLNINNSSCKYTKLEETDSKKLLVSDDDDDDENEDKVFVR